MGGGDAGEKHDNTITMGGDHHVDSYWTRATPLDLDEFIRSGDSRTINAQLLTHCFDATVGVGWLSPRRAISRPPSLLFVRALFPMLAIHTCHLYRWFIAIILLGGWNSCWNQEFLLFFLWEVFLALLM